MTDVVRRPSTRDAMVAAAEAELRTSGMLSLDSAARAAGVTKPGLMYHFSTKEELMTAVLDRVLTRYEVQLTAALGAPDFADAPVADRMRAYVGWACAGECESGDLVMFADPRLRESLTQHWAERIEPWLHVPDDVPAEHRAALLTARLLADGVWFNLASDLLPLDAAALDGVRAAALAMLETVDA
ncbi:TetR/AcrR family transcriptional regulator [Nocardioides baculatus]|uniref:TetR/AcrR family transcriptional regulator n=1 Tax=Nocardioides baculatus TaxID=2801337 RepID=A0ABS1L567_9ACTN|nr:TetR/AcrR family transcriptional regulator [Nocardioides baculatus]MBL0746750.1 TetR/AcrR family transcriptional regulator [Nocardioides baculatus]